MKIVKIGGRDGALVQGSYEPCHASAVVVGGGLHNFCSINVTRDAVTIEAQLEVVPQAGGYAGYHSFGQRVFATNLHVLTGEDEGLLFLVANEFFLVELSAGEDERHLPFVVHLQIVTLGPDAIARTHVAETTHHSGLVAGIQIYVGTDFVVLPVGIAQDGVVVPFGCPAEGVGTNGLAEAKAIT